MKIYTYIKYLGITLAFLSSGSLFTSCTNEELTGPSYPKGEGGVTLNISLPDPITIDPMTRAGAADFNKINDLNVVIADGEGDNAGIKEVLYIDSSTPAQGEIADGISIESEEGRDIPSLHFSKEAYPGENIYVVANWGSKITTNVTSISELKQLKQTTAEQTGAAGVPIGTMLFGQAKAIGSDKHNGTKMEVELLRTVAMITVVIDGTDLNENVVITPTRVSLCNVPNSCYIGNDNIDLKASDCVPNGETKDAGTMWLKSITKGQTTGKHFSSTAYNDEQVEPLFLFENMHTGGDSFGANNVTEDNQKSKRPNGVEDNPKAIEENTKNCSYLKVEAKYEYKATGKEIAGTVAFKLFLGENVTNNFDVKRNHYYKVTLNLSGTVVTEDGHMLNSDGTLVVNNSDASWRIDSHLDKVTILTGDVNINASGDFFFLEVAGQENVQWRMYSAESLSFTWIYNTQFNYWGSIGSNPSSAVKQTGIPKGGIMIYCSPWNNNQDTQTQTIIFEINEGGNWKEVKRIKVTQHAPIKIDLPKADELPEGLKDFANHVMWLDRIDRTSLPWGFDGTVFKQTHGTNAFQNVYNLVRTDSENGFQYLYYQTSEKYLPWGKGNGGSAMIYAICLNSYSDASPSGTPESIAQNSKLPTASELSDRYYNSNKHLWTIPTIAGWQVIEKYGSEAIKNSGYPIHSYNEYWTSNAVTVEDHQKFDEEGNKYAYYYQYNAGYKETPTGAPYPLYALREQPKLFRCIAISKEKSGWWN